MNRMTTPLVRWSVSVACTAFLGPVAYADVAGHVQFVNGQVQLSNASSPTRSLQKGDTIREGDTLISAAAASAQIRMQDGGLVAVRPETQLKFDQFVFNGKQDGTERSFFSLLKGGFRAVTGLVGQLNKTNYRIVTPVATIGIRGTDHETFLIVPGSALAQLAPAGAYSKVNVGETTLTTNQGSIHVTPNQMGFAAGLNQPPLVQPINTKVFTVAQTPAAPAPGAKKESAVADNTSPAAGPTEGSAPAGDAAAKEPATASTSPTGNTTESRPPAGDAPSGSTATASAAAPSGTPSDGSAASAPPAAPPPILRTTAAVDSVAPNANLIPISNTPPPPSTTQTSLTAPPASTPPPPTTATATGGTTVNLTTAAATTSSGQVIAISDGVVAAQAQTAATAALAAYTSAQSATAALQAASTQTAGLVPVDTTSAAAAITAASAAITSATTATNDAVALVPANVVTANANASTAASIASSVASQLASAQTKYAANGSYRDSSATPALISAQTANTALQTAATAVQDAATAVGSNKELLELKQGLAQSELESANPALTSANGYLTGTNGATAKNTDLVNAQSAAASANATHLVNAQAATAAAQSAANAAQAAATLAASLQASGDLTGAQAQLTTAQAQLAIAQSKQALAATERTAVEAALASAQTILSDAQTALTSASDQAGTAQSHANTASTYAGIAQTAYTDAQTALAATSTGLSGINSNAATVASQSAIAAYHNPAVTRNVNAVAVLPVGSASSFNAGQASSTTPVANTTVVLDGNGNLVEARNLAYVVRAFQNGTPVGSPIASADVKYTGGTAADTFKLADNSIYAGRWMGATVTVSDNNSAATSSATPAASLWAVILPPAVSFVPSLTGTTSYSQVAATQPVDAAGNLGTLNSATLNANFTTMTLDAGANLTLGSGTMAGTFQLTATGMAIGPLGGFESSTASTTTTACTTGTCSAGGTGYSSSLGGGLAGDGAASAGLLYRLWPTSMYPNDPVSNAVDGLVAFQAGTAPTIAPGETYNSTALSLAVTDKSRFNANVLLMPGHVTLDTNNAPTTWFRYWEGLEEFAVTTIDSPYSSNLPVSLAGGLRYGSWDSTGGVSDAVTLTLRPDMQFRDFGSVLPVYLLGQQGYLDAAVNPGVQTGPLVGTFSYTPVLHVSKDARSWADSTLTSASLSANFTTQTVDVALGGLTSGQYWSTTSNGNVLNFGNSANGSGVQFRNDNAQVKVDSTPITVGTPVCVTCSAHINGTFTGQNYAGAILNYALHRNDAQDLDVAGLVALDRMGVVANPVVSNGVAAPTGFRVVATTWGIDQPYSLSVALDGNNVLNTWAFDQHATDIAPASGSIAMGSVGTAGSGAIDWGTWAAGSIWTRSDGYTPGSNTLLWITAPEPTPVYLSQVLTGSVNYSLMGGKVTNAAGSEGTLVSANTFLTANFTQQTVGLSINAQFSGHNWVASASNVPLKFLDHGTRNGFWADSQNPSLSPDHLTVTVDGQAAIGSVAGQLAGANTDYAILKFNLEGTGTAGYTDQIQGVAGLSADTPNNANAAYRSMLMSITNPGSTSPATLMDGSYTADSRTTLSGVHAQTFDHGNSTIAFTGGTPTGGSAVIDGATVAWGRWSAGSTVNTTDRASGTVVPYTLAGGAHIITGPLMTGPVALPTTGTYNYTIAGNTDPTDHTGVTGSLTSATLSANFTNQTVDVGVNVSVAGSTMGATANAVPILQRSHFQADSRSTGSNPLAVTCSGICGTTNQASIAGGFTGTNGKAAGMAYGFTREGVNAGTINGVVVFQRP